METRDWVNDSSTVSEGNFLVDMIMDAVHINHLDK